MGEESVKGANLGVILIIFASILALGLIVFMLARNMANTGLTNVSEKLQAAEESEFTDFDGSVVVGQRVHAALSAFKGKKVAVLIATQGFIDKLAVGPAGGEGGTVYAASSVKTDLNKAAKGGILLDTASLGAHENLTLAFAMQPEYDKAILTRTSANVDRALVFIQYNALLEPSDEKGNTVAGKDNKHSAIKYENGTYIFDGAFRTDTSEKMLFDLDFANLSKTGMTEMVPGAARFHANLLKDANGVILGVVFQQVSN